ncbi:MAG: Gfo/Idh/MocA family protein [Anaerolineae bacterium]
MSTFPIRAIIVGAGHRALLYASYAQHYPDELQIVGVAEPIDHRREQVARLYDLPAERCYKTAEEVAAQPKFADVAINGTMDHQHVETSLPLLKAGYDLLLEKPFATSEPEMWRLIDAVRHYDRTVMICHVLRYAPFYAAIRQRVQDGVIGDILSVQTVEHVSYHHMAMAFVRGKWAHEADGYASMLMAKCSHDLDLIAWMKSGVRPKFVASFGSNFQFRPERAPEGAGTRCLVDCAIEPNCLYSARKHYIDHPERWRFYVWDRYEHAGDHLTLEEKIASLKDDNPFGRCVWRTDPDVVDHQSILIDFADGSTATHNMIGGTARPSRSIHIVGTLGEIQGVFEESQIVIRHIDPRPGCEYTEDVVDLSIDGDMHGALGGHGGGDLRLVADFVRVVRGEAPSISTTTLEDSMSGHLIGFSADRAMEERRVVEVSFR